MESAFLFFLPFGYAHRSRQECYLVDESLKRQGNALAGEVNLFYPHLHMFSQ